MGLLEIFRSNQAVAVNPQPSELEKERARLRELTAQVEALNLELGQALRAISDWHAMHHDRRFAFENGEVAVHFDALHVHPDLRILEERAVEAQGRFWKALAELADVKENLQKRGIDCE